MVRVVLFHTTKYLLLQTIQNSAMASSIPNILKKPAFELINFVMYVHILRGCEQIHNRNLHKLRKLSFSIRAWRGSRSRARQPCYPRLRESWKRSIIEICTSYGHYHSQFEHGAAHGRGLVNLVIHVHTTLGKDP